MLVLIIVFVFFMLHIQFLVEVVFFNQIEYDFFTYHFVYNYSKETAEQALIFTIVCLTCFLIGYYLIKKPKKIDFKTIDMPLAKDPAIFNIVIAFLLFLMVCMCYVAIQCGFEYNAMAKMRNGQLSFIFEMRMIPTVLFSYILLNSSPKDWKRPIFRRLAIVLLFYGVSLVVMQARSLAFEYFVVLGFYWLRINNNKFKIRYIIYLYIASLIPNLIVLNRFHAEDITLKDIFTYEYSLLFNNILSEALITFKSHYLYGETLLNGIKLIIPSFLRDALGMEVDKSLLYDTAVDALPDGFGGGFSLLAELYMNFGYFACLFFLLFGMAISHFNNHVFYRKSVSLFYSIGPLIYTNFILVFRNDLGVFIKQIVQLSIIVFIFHFLMKVSTHYQKSETNELDIR